MRQVQWQPIVSMASNASFTSAPIDMRQNVYFSIQVIGAAGSLAGTFQIQVCDIPCLDAFQNYAPPAYGWANLGSPLTFSQSSTASNQMIPKTDSSYVALRVVFTDSSGGSNTSLMSVYGSAMGV